MKLNVFTFFSIVVIVIVSLFSVYAIKASQDADKEMTYEYLDTLNENKNNFIENEDVALKLGEIMLRNAFPNYIQSHNLKIEFGVINTKLDETTNVWKVFAGLKPLKKNSSLMYCSIGSPYVLFYRSGEIIEFGIEK